MPSMVMVYDYNFTVLLQYDPNNLPTLSKFYYLPEKTNPKVCFLKHVQSAVREMNDIHQSSSLAKFLHPNISHILPLALFPYLLVSFYYLLLLS